MTPLKYPDDRHLGYVILTDASGIPYVPEFTGARCISYPHKYCQAVMELMRRAGTPSWLDIKQQTENA